MSLTHQVAVIAYIFEKNRFLFLLRNTEPFIWAPPGGHLGQDENPVDGIKREILEETGLHIEVIAPVNTWFGEWNGSRLLSIDYLVKVTGGELTLSEEHSDYKWVTIEELREGKPIRLDSRLGFTLDDFENAWRLIRLLETGLPD